MSIILRAARLAAIYHREQRRTANGRPYLTHLIRVAGRTATQPGATENDVAGAFLHDLIEDQATSQERHSDIITVILKECGSEVINIVVDLTNASKGSTQPRAERKRADRLHLARCPRNVKVIKLIDRIDNVNESISDVQLGLEKRFDFQLKYCDESELLLYEALVGTDLALELELSEAIERLREVCATPKTT